MTTTQKETRAFGMVDNTLHIDWETTSSGEYYRVQVWIHRTGTPPYTCPVSWFIYPKHFSQALRQAQSRYAVRDWQNHRSLSLRQAIEMAQLMNLDAEIKIIMQELGWTQEEMER